MRTPHMPLVGCRQTFPLPWGYRYDLSLGLEFRVRVRYREHVSDCDFQGGASVREGGNALHSTAALSTLVKPIQRRPPSPVQLS